jgi:hypothetical protein
MRLSQLEGQVKSQTIHIQELERSVQYLGANLQEASTKYNGLVEAFAIREQAVNDMLRDHQLQVCWTIQHQF